MPTIAEKTNRKGVAVDPHVFDGIDPHALDEKVAEIRAAKREHGRLGVVAAAAGVPVEVARRRAGASYRPAVNH